jgi:hypothetical protein
MQSWTAQSTSCTLKSHLLYKATKKAIKVGFVFQDDLGKVKSVHVAETIVPVEAFSLKQTSVQGE